LGKATSFDARGFLFGEQNPVIFELLKNFNSGKREENNYSKNERL
jgi:hypothetical protein